MNWDDRRSCENILKHDTHSKHHLELYFQKKKYATYGDKNQPPPLCTNNFPPSFILYTKISHKKKLTFAAAPDETSSFSMTAVLKLFHSVWTSPNPSPLRLEWEAPHLTACDVTFRYVGPNSGGGFTQVGRQKNNC